jgi:hypothetical protein
MPQMNGKHYRSFSQAAGAAKEPSNQSVQEKPADGGSIAHVKHHGGGKFSVKHDDGTITKHDSAEDLHAHLDEHFGVQDEPTGDEGMEDYEGEGDSGEALKSILG